ncbi:MAG: UDP-N-acetylglucosamine 2-epimerase, partial [Bacteroidales bacterium]|nr:UDP-N-acetylglucosamine 2-epimerase [Bacteroidales bacterium]
MKLLTIIGARPQIIKAAALSRAIEKEFKTRVREVILHTDQHYDDSMSEVFFREMQIPAPDYNLGIGSASHGSQTGQMIEGIEKALLEEKPNGMVVYGDTNSTLAGALAASKLHIPVIHIEAGLRSFNKQMPEEINRIACDHVSTLLFSPTRTGVNNLEKEGIVHHENQPLSFDRQGVYHN